MAPAKPTYASVDIPARAGSDDGSDLFEEPASKRITTLLCVNLGLLLFACGGLTYLTHGWDPTAFLCTAGYVMCGLGLAPPMHTGSARPRPRITYPAAHRNAGGSEPCARCVHPPHAQRTWPSLTQSSRVIR